MKNVSMPRFRIYLEKYPRVEYLWLKNVSMPRFRIYPEKYPRVEYSMVEACIICLGSGYI